MAKEIKNIAASIRARLVNIANESKRDYNSVLRLYFQERFLYRLSISEYKSKFVLKGALLLMLNDITKFRPTKDIDFMGRALDNDIAECKKTVSSIASVECEDGVSFLTENISAEFIKEDANYKGVRIHLPYRMDTINSYLSIDIGFGDKIIQGPCELDFPTLLDSPSPKILVYSYESAVAEKFEAIVKLNFLTSRMKDFFDLIFIAERNSFEKKNLKTALETTFNNRGTNLEERAIIFEDKFKLDQNKQIQWIAFLQRNKLTSNNNFAEVVERINQFIEPVFSEDKAQNWNYEEWKWV